jgi:hypothetical protein
MCVRNPSKLNFPPLSRYAKIYSYRTRGFYALLHLFYPFNPFTMACCYYDINCAFFQYFPQFFWTSDVMSWFYIEILKIELHNVNTLNPRLRLQSFFLKKTSYSALSEIFENGKYIKRHNFQTVRDTFFSSKIERSSNNLKNPRFNFQRNETKKIVFLVKG